MPLYKNLTAVQKKSVDTFYRDKVNLLLHTMIAVNTVRMDPDTAPADASRLDAKYADLQIRLGLVEKGMTDVYGNKLSISPPDQPTIDAIEALSAQVDQLNQNQAVASATLILADKVLASATEVAKNV